MLRLLWWLIFGPMPVQKTIEELKVESEWEFFLVSPKPRRLISEAGDYRIEQVTYNWAVVESRLWPDTKGFFMMGPFKDRESANYAKQTFYETGVQS